MDLQILVIVVVVVLSILDAVMKKAKKRGMELPQSDEPSGAPEVRQGRARPVPGPEAASRPSTAGPPSAGKRQSALDILVPPEIRKELEDLVSGGGPRIGQSTPPPTQASGSGDLSGTSAQSGPHSLPTPGEPMETSGPAWAPTPERSRAPSPAEVRSRVPRPVEVWSRESRQSAASTASPPIAEGRSDRSVRLPAPAPVGADYAPSPEGRAPDPSQLGLDTVTGLRRLVVAREVLGPPIALREDGEFGAPR